MYKTIQRKMLHLFTHTNKLTHTNHSVCLKPAAVKGREGINYEDFMRNFLKTAVPHQCDKQSPHTPS